MDGEHSAESEAEMKPGKSLSAAALALALAVPAKTLAFAASFTAIETEALRVTNDADIVDVGYRHSKYRKFEGGISYAGEYGLRYAPSYWKHRHHGHDVTVNIYAEPPRYADHGQRSRALIIELPE